MTNRQTAYNGIRRDRDHDQLIARSMLDWVDCGYVARLP